MRLIPEYILYVFPFRAAKAKKVRIWKNYTPVQMSLSNSKREFTATVSNVAPHTFFRTLRGGGVLSTLFKKHSK